MSLTQDQAVLQMETAQIELLDLNNPFVPSRNLFVAPNNPSVSLNHPFVPSRNPFVTLNNPFVTLRNPFVTLNNPFVTLRNPFVPSFNKLSMPPNGIRNATNIVHLCNIVNA